MMMIMLIIILRMPKTMMMMFLIVISFFLSPGLLPLENHLAFQREKFLPHFILEPSFDFFYIDKRNLGQHNGKANCAQND